MKNLILAATFALAPMTASAAGIDLKPQATPAQVPAGECTAKGVTAFFDETSTGLRCPAVGWEKAAGGVAAIGAFAGILHASGAVQIFPLNGAGSAFSGF